MTAIQIAISLAAITLLTRRRWLQYMPRMAPASPAPAVALLAAAHI